MFCAAPQVMMIQVNALEEAQKQKAQETSQGDIGALMRMESMYTGFGGDSEVIDFGDGEDQPVCSVLLCPMRCRRVFNEQGIGVIGSSQHL